MAAAASAAAAVLHSGADSAKKRMDSQRRQAAVSFLSNISLDGRPARGDNSNQGDAEMGPEAKAKRGFKSAEPAVHCAQTIASGVRSSFGLTSLVGAACGSAEGDVFRATRGRLQTFTQGALPATFPRQTSQSYCCFESGQIGSSVFELQRSRRRLLSQRSSLETLEDIEENAPLRRCRTMSGSPRPKSSKKVHFIKNMRQHDTRNGRYGWCCRISLDFRERTNIIMACHRSIMWEMFSSPWMRM